MKKHTIHPLDLKAMEEAGQRQDSLLKPPGSLGELEKIAVRLAGICASPQPSIGSKAILIFAGDHGVTEEGVASAPGDYTAIQTVQILRGRTGVGVLAGQAGAVLKVIDVGIRTDLTEEGLIHAKVRPGTGNICREEAMSREEAIRAIETGVEQVDRAVREGYRLIGVGEMGIGNTTAASAIAHAMLPQVPVRDLVGKGAGLTDEAFEKKKQVVQQAVRLHKVGPEDPLAVLQKVGGLEICAMAGAYIGAAEKGIPAVIDGMISMTAAYMAEQLVPGVRQYMFASHASKEPAYTILADKLGLSPVLSLGMRLGEGSGCPLMFLIMEAACKVQREMISFEEAQTSGDFIIDIRQDHHE